MIRYADILLAVPIKKEFVYSFDDEKYNVVPGVRVKVQFGSVSGLRTGYVVRTYENKPDVKFEVKEIETVIDSNPVFNDELYNLAVWMEKFYLNPRGENLDAMIPGGKLDRDYNGISASAEESPADITLTCEQQNALDTIVSSDRSMFYLFGITGSGKTEVYLRAAQHFINEGGQVIYLVPEITLTHQLAYEVSKRFEDKVAVLHSGLTNAQRIKQWRRVISGECSLVIGARSAVFAPCNNLKLIIIDEEHENSYKSSSNPRYHARQIAQKRISTVKGKLIMGSATPSLEAWYRTKEPDGPLLLELTRRPGQGNLPEIIVSKMDSRRNGGSDVFGTELISEINKTILENRQVILFLNRRGFSYYFHCNVCGYIAKCPNCDVTMVYHKSKNRLQCHYCEHSEKPRSSCPSCGSRDVSFNGFGTEYVESEMKRLFPGITYARLDTDTVSSDKKLVKQVLEDFGNNKIKILLGTQMVAKGLNFPNVKLVGVIQADSSLFVPDFRSHERTFSLLVQVCGRSGRSDSEGKVVVQTMNPEHPVISYGVRRDVRGFMDKELSYRKVADFPPYSRLIFMVFRCKKADRALEFAANIYQSLSLLISGEGLEVTVFPPSPCVIEKLNNYYRYQLIIKGKDLQMLLRAVNTVTDCLKIPTGVHMEIDVDPVDLL